MGILKGKDLMIFIKDLVIGYSTSCDLDIQSDTKEITSGSYKHLSTAGQWKKYESDKKGWTCNSDYVIEAGFGDVDNLFDMLVAGTPVDIKFGVATIKAESDLNDGDTGSIEIKSTAKGYKGKGIVTSIKVSAQDESDCTYSISIQGTGVLEKL